jgi:hypothetical protein
MNIIKLKLISLLYKENLIKHATVKKIESVNKPELKKHKTEAVIKSKKITKEQEKDSEKNINKDKLNSTKKSLKSSITDKKTEEKDNKIENKNKGKNLTLDMNELVSNFDDEVKPKKDILNQEKPKEKDIFLYRKIKNDKLKLMIVE